RRLRAAAATTAPRATDDRARPRHLRRRPRSRPPPRAGPTTLSASPHRAAARCARSRCLAPGRCAAARARRSPLPIRLSALDDVYSEAAARGLLVLAAHVGARAPHRLDHLVERHLVRAIAL